MQVTIRQWRVDPPSIVKTSSRVWSSQGDGAKNFARALADSILGIDSEPLQVIAELVLALSSANDHTLGDMFPGIVAAENQLINVAHTLIVAYEDAWEDMSRGLHEENEACRSLEKRGRP